MEDILLFLIPAAIMALSGKKTTPPETADEPEQSTGTQNEPGMPPPAGVLADGTPFYYDATSGQYYYTDIIGVLHTAENAINLPGYSGGAGTGFGHDPEPEPEPEPETPTTVLNPSTTPEPEPGTLSSQQDQATNPDIIPENVNQEPAATEQDMINWYNSLKLIAWRTLETFGASYSDKQYINEFIEGGYNLPFFVDEFVGRFAALATQYTITSTYAEAVYAKAYAKP